MGVCWVQSPPGHISLLLPSLEVPSAASVQKSVSVPAPAFPRSGCVHVSGRGLGFSVLAAVCVHLPAQRPVRGREHTALRCFLWPRHCSRRAFDTSQCICAAAPRGGPCDPRGSLAQRLECGPPPPPPRPSCQPAPGRRASPGTVLQTPTLPPPRMDTWFPPVDPHSVIVPSLYRWAVTVTAELCVPPVGISALQTRTRVAVATHVCAVKPVVSHSPGHFPPSVAKRVGEPHSMVPF